MNERDCYFYWKARGLDDLGLIKQVALTINKLPKTPGAKSMKHGVAKCVSLIKAFSYWLRENGCSWSSWAYLGLHEHNFMYEGGTPAKLSEPEA